MAQDKNFQNIIAKAHKEPSGALKAQNNLNQGDKEPGLQKQLKMHAQKSDPAPSALD